MIKALSYTPKKIIVRMPNWIGDLVMATPVLTDLKKKFPDAEITAMCLAPLSDLLKEDRDINELYRFTKLPNGFARRKAKRNIIEKLREGKYDTGLLLTNSFSSAWWFWQGNVPTRIGFSCDGRSLFLTNPVPIPAEVKKQHLVITYKKLLEPFGIPVSTSAPRLFMKEEEVKRAKELLYQRGYVAGKRLIGINPGAAYGSAKCWPAERYRLVAERLLEDPDTYVVFFGDSSNVPLVKGICQGMSKRAMNLAGITSLRELMALIKDCDLLLTNDSGPMHIAAALGTPIVALFGSTDDQATGPYQGGVVINKRVACSPCFKRTCPIDFRCMLSITVEEVVDAIIKKLEK